MDNVNTYFEVLKWASSFLEKHDKEAYIAEYLLLEKYEWSKTDLLMHFNKEMPIEEKEPFFCDLKRVVENVPPQYIIGSCLFYDERFLVSKETLIPRPETEELVSLCLNDNTENGLKVVDVGTGTGVIGITLKKQRPSWFVTSIDISSGALDVARKNAERLAVDIDFRLGDTLAPVEKEKVDIIVSNPPYISHNEWDVMDESVREFEPKVALFAEDNGLEMYKKIALEAQSVLKKSGRIYLEIGYLQGESVKSLFEEAFPSKTVSILKDMFGQDRMIKVN